jgi:hypothetical protein
LLVGCSAFAVEEVEAMLKLISTTIAISILLIFSGCSSNNQNNQTVQQRQACTAGDQHPWCMQMAQTKPLGAAPYGLESTGPTNPEMRDDNMPYPRNPALSIAGGFHF